MTARIMQQVSFEGPAYIGRWLLEHDVSSRTVHLYREEALPRRGISTCSSYPVDR